ncbi:hypothetical protein AB434_0281 [Heyndrickxia coagulans]|uniref:Uncharacterized protein n=1 Tax=Heyndrickxia coagulans TaxID=1398 RepID=A0A0C5C543_HEYCO|nr:hypothetical protein SB48_HM08orf01407 [Heyndrickxia coagulans]AKN52686.1 hypothetical protein AB434_0281 [Heyndrickxia coagulans]KWZ79726.1 hypothetical protein HMPREF3213_02502 [Heyndrickxia coagulans]KYC62008.1 hypothetical protein B4100_2225 [Heyndrickxia coagulans]
MYACFSLLHKGISFFKKFVHHLPSFILMDAGAIVTENFLPAS